VSAPKIPPRPSQLNDAVRLANEALKQLDAAIESLDDATEFDDLYLQLEAAKDDMRSSIGYMTAVPELEYLGQHIHQVQA
jgi:hypothetical protein